MADGKVTETARNYSSVEVKDTNKKTYRNPWAWVPSLYFAEGIPYVMVMTVSVVMYKKMGISNTDIAFFTSLLYFPWILKFFWSPIIDMFKTKRFWITSTQLLLSAALVGIGLMLHLPSFLFFTLLIFSIMAFASATHDIAADGFYMLSLDQQEQSAFVGVRSTFYRFAMITGQGALVVLAGILESHVGIANSWMITFFAIAAIFFSIYIYHRFILPYPHADKGILEGKRYSKKEITALVIYLLLGGGVLFLIYEIINYTLVYFGTPDILSTVLSLVLIVIGLIQFLKTNIAKWIDAQNQNVQGNTDNPLIEFLRTFVIFVRKRNVWVILSFLFFYRFAEAQLVKLVSPFLLDPINKGGLGLSTSQVGIAYGTTGIIALTIGGLLGGYAISKKGLRWWLWPMVLVMHLPDLVFVYLSHFQPSNLILINTAVGFEQFGYGFGFTAYMMYMIMISEGEHKTSHYAICTAFMALGMMLPGMFSGWLQDMIGYKNFFIWVMFSTIPGFIVAALVKVDPEFGKLKKAV